MSAEDETGVEARVRHGRAGIAEWQPQVRRARCQRRCLGRDTGFRLEDALEVEGAHAGPRAEARQCRRSIRGFDQPASPGDQVDPSLRVRGLVTGSATAGPIAGGLRSEEHTSELQSLMRISYAVF